MRISIIPEPAMTRRTPNRQSQVLSRLRVMKEVSRDFREGASASSEGIDLLFIGQQRDDTTIVLKTKHAF